VSGEPILVVDDNAINLKLVRVVLVGAGFDVRAVQDAEEAIALLDSYTPRLILMDLQLPGMDGYELTRRLKADARTAEIVIVAVTSYAMKGDEQRAFDAGCDGYVSKPIDTEALPRIVEAHLSRNNGRAP
jgi:CheY-like chemotaxis protein